MLRTIERIGTTAAICLAVCSSAFAQGSWADALVDVKRIDYGVVATGAETLRVITIRNTTGAPVHISSVSTACKCAEAGQPSKSLLQPGEEATLDIRLNTRQFSKKRDTSATIFFDSPQYASVLIPITAYIRTDVVFDPGIVRFGTVDYGAGAELNVKVAYAGRTEWQISDIRIANKYLTVTRVEKKRGNGLVDYDLVVKLDKDAPPQRIRELITLVTDDAANPYVPLMVEGTIVPDIAVTPEVVKLQKAMAPGESTDIQIVIKGKRPFIIEKIDCAGMPDQFTTTLGSQARPVHVVKMKFTAPEKAGDFNEELAVKIADREEPVRFRVYGEIRN